MVRAGLPLDNTKKAAHACAAFDCKWVTLGYAQP